MRKLPSCFFIVVFLVCHLSKAQGQLAVEPDTSHAHIGLNYGRASQSIFPFDNPNYSYETQYLKLQIRNSILKKSAIQLNLLIEPSFYIARHQLLQESFIQPTTPDYLELRKKFSRKRTFYEYALNVGIMARLLPQSMISPYLLGSIGPMLSSSDTERLKKGFAFSDILGLGLLYRINSSYVDLRITLRHNSNANLATPNSGHNSVGLELGFSIPMVD